MTRLTIGERDSLTLRDSTSIFSIGRPSLSLGNAGGGGAAIPPVDLAAAGGSLRFPEHNLLTNDATEAAALVQPAVGSGSGIFTGNGALFAVVRLPRVARNENYNFGIMGHGTSAQNRWALRFYGGAYFTGSSQNKFNGFFRGNSATAASVASVDCLEDAALVTLKKTSGDWVMDWYSLIDGTKNAGTPTAVAPAAAASFTTDFCVGHANNGTPTLTAIAAGQIAPWPGEIDCVGYFDGTSADADWQAIALGADPVAQLGSANLKYYRRLDGTSGSYAAASSGDAFASLTEWNGSNLKVGSHIRRKTSANYVTIDNKVTGHVFGLFPGATSRSCSFSGKAGGYTGDVQIRVFNDATGAVVLDWTTIGAISAGAWSGSVTLPKTSGWLNAQVRPASTPSDVVDMRSPFGVGYKFLLLGQSQMEIARSTSNASFNSFERKHRMSVLTTGLSQYRMGNFKLSDGMAYFETQFGKFDTTTPVQLVWDAVVGTGMDQLMSDSEGTRLWTLLQSKLDFGGNDFTAVVHQWVTNDAGANYVPRLEALFFNTGSAVSDHSLATSLAAGFGVAYSPPSRYSTNSLHDSSRTAGVSFAVTNGWTVGPYTSDMQIEDGGGPHQKLNVLKGNPLLGARLGLAAAKATGLTSVNYPAFAGTATLSTNTITVPVTMANGGSLYSPNSSDVKSFEVDDGGVGSWSATGFTAAVSGNSVVITKTAGNWAAGSKVRYKSNLATRTDGDGAAETAIIDGALYETWAQDPLGLGLPVTPILAETVAA